jgi:vacuolar-type H+-ATPase subunit E/Vma4
MDGAKIADVRAELAKAEQSSGAKQQQALTQLVTRLESEVNGARDAAKAQALATTVKQLANSPSLATAGK